MRLIARLAALLGLGLGLGLVLTMVSAQAAEPTLTLRIGERRIEITRQSLLAHPAAREVEITADPAYRRAMRYRAVPLTALLAGFAIPDGATLEGKATDGFVAQIPLPPALGQGGAQALIAVEPADAPWPALPGKNASAGPFFLIWTDEKAQGIGPEQWPYMLAALSIEPPPARRWPQIAVDPALPPAAPARLGQDVFVKHCFACHRMNGGGEAAVGPDLNLPMNPTEYFQPPALRRYLRDPASVRAWPEQKMPAIGAEQMSDAELEQVLAYLRHMAGRRAGR
ncbi:MAG: cytochrome c [Reyranellaceae bacterium]